MQELETLRLFVRNVLRNIKNQQKESLRKEINENRKLRKSIRSFLREKQDTVQHNSTGINALEKLLSSVVPILEVGYKDLKTDANQRKSFKAHILRAIQNLLSTASVYFSADKKANGETPPAATGGPMLAQPPQAGAAPPEAGLKEVGEDGTAAPAADPVGPETDPAFIDVNKDKKQEKPNPINAFQTVEGEDLTGRNFALETFKKIQKQILETYSLLSNEQDREVFYDYLLTNTKLYFDKFETELESTPAEPTTPEYEAEKAKIDASLQGGAPAPGGLAPPATGGAPAPAAGLQPPIEELE
jgi:hypothetical protein